MFWELPVDPSSFLVGLRPPEPEAQLPRVGQRVRWPGDDREWVWDGQEWVGLRTAFDGGDAWEDPDAEREAA